VRARDVPHGPAVVISLNVEVVIRIGGAMAERKRLVILGSGFAAFKILKKIDVRRYDVTIISPRNHFLFTPLLPSTTVGTVELRSIIEPIRKARRRADFIQAEAFELDPATRTVRCRSNDHSVTFDQPYDVLVIAIGADNNTFGIPGVEEHAVFLKELSDARMIRCCTSSSSAEVRQA
jgi:NADH:ubiquinone reductase (non-electrogenic)